MTQRLLAYLRIPTVFTAPASYSVLPVENIFGYIKAGYSVREHKSVDIINEAKERGGSLSSSELDMLRIAERIQTIDRERIRNLFAVTLAKMVDFVAMTPV